MGTIIEALSSYHTVKFVKIRSRRLGLLHNVLLLVVDDDTL